MSRCTATSHGNGWGLGTMSELQVLSPDDITFNSYKIITDLPLSRRSLSNVHGLLKIAIVLWFSWFWRYELSSSLWMFTQVFFNSLTSKLWAFKLGYYGIWCFFFRDRSWSSRKMDFQVGYLTPICFMTCIFWKLYWNKYFHFYLRTCMLGVECENYVCFHESQIQEWS